MPPAPSGGVYGRLITDPTPGWVAALTASLPARPRLNHGGLHALEDELEGLTVLVSNNGRVVPVAVAVADDETALAFQQLLADRWATATAQHTTRDAGEPGVRLRCYLDLSQSIVTTPETM